jgi:hypothetical protein
MFILTVTWKSPEGLKSTSSSDLRISNRTSTNGTPEVVFENRPEETEQVLVMLIMRNDYYNQHGIYVFFQWRIYVNRKDII